MQWLIEFLNQTTIPYSFRMFDWLHLSFLVLLTPLFVFGAWKLRNLSDQALRKIYAWITVLLYLTEIYRQLYAILILEGGRMAWWAFPFQLSSMPLYLCPLVVILWPKPSAQAIHGWFAAYGILGGLMAMIVPTYMVSNSLLLSIGAFLWHGLMFFLGLLSGFSGKAGTKWKEYRRVIFLLAAMCLTALLINIFVKEVFDRPINMFFIGPEISPIIVFQTVAQTYGWQVNAVFYFFMLALGGFLCWFPFVLYHKRKNQSPEESKNF